MKIIVFTPIDHFHAPIVLRELLYNSAGDEFLIVTTPKLLGRGNFLTRLWRIVKQSGWDYLISMVWSKLMFNFLRLMEITQPFEKRKYLTVLDVIHHFKLAHYHFCNVNSSQHFSILANFKPDVILTLFFNQILKETLCQLSILGSINLHPSYLPRYRGISPCFWVLAQGEIETGVTIHYLVKKPDAGNILVQEKVPIYPKDSFFSLYRRCARVGAKMLPLAIKMLQQKALGIKQDESQASYYGSITSKAVRAFRRRGRRFFSLSESS